MQLNEVFDTLSDDLVRKVSDKINSFSTRVEKLEQATIHIAKAQEMTMQRATVQLQKQLDQQRDMQQLKQQLQDLQRKQQDSSFNRQPAEINGACAPVDNCAVENQSAIYLESKHCQSATKNDADIGLLTQRIKEFALYYQSYKV